MELNKQDFHPECEYSCDLSNILRNYLRLGYHLGVFPYYIRHPRADGDDGAATTQKLNKLIVLFYITSSVVLNFCFLRSYIGASRFGSIHEPLTVHGMIYIIVYTSWISFSAVIKLILCKTARKFRKLLDCLDLTERSGRSAHKPPQWHRAIPFILGMGAIIGCFEDMFFVVLRVHEDGLWGSMNGYAESIRRTRNWLAGADECYENARCFLTSDAVIAAVLFLGNTYSNLVTYYVNHLCLCLALTYFLAATKGLGIPSAKRLPFYEQMHKLSNAVNEAAGGLISIAVLTDLPFFSFKVQKALDGDLATMAQVFTTFGPYFAFLLLSARARSLVRGEIHKLCFSAFKQRSYLQRHDSETSDSVRIFGSVKTFILLSNSEVGITGRVFVINYRLIGNLIGLIVTYAVVIIQFKQQVTPDCACS